MDPEEQCYEDPPVPLPYKKHRRFYPGGEEEGPKLNIPNPKCFYIVDDSGKTESPVNSAEISSDSIDNNDSTNFLALSA